MTLTVNTVGDNPQQPGIWAEAYVPDQLIAGNLKLVSQPITLAAGTLPRGSVLGRVTATGQYKLSVAGASDGSQNPSVILADAADASSGAVATGAYVLGEFNANALNFDASWTVATLTPILQPLGLFIKSAVTAADPT